MMSELTEIFKYAGDLFSRFFRVMRWRVHYWIGEQKRSVLRKSYSSLVRECEETSRFIRESSCSSVEQIVHYTNKWKKLLFKITKKEGYGKKTAKALWQDFGIMCNWEHLHQTENEKKRTPGEWKDYFAWELFYCSDRWSFERLLRVQWLFRQWEEAALLKVSKNEG